MESIRFHLFRQMTARVLGIDRGRDLKRKQGWIRGLDARCEQLSASGRNLAELGLLGC